MAPQVTAALRALPAVVLTGARQTGKTTLVQMLDPARRYLTLDDFEAQDQARAAPGALLEPPMILDEVQRAPELLVAIKRRIDQDRRPGDFLLTGSANLLLSHRVSESLAGRALYLELPPFCPGEWMERTGGLRPLEALFAGDFSPADWPREKGDWIRWLLRGGFPPALALPDAAARDFWFRGYVQTFLERDLRGLSAVSSLPDFQRVMGLAANQSARIINQANLARDAALAHATTHRYLNLLETACMLQRVPPYALNLAGAVVKLPRWFWCDCGLAAWLAGIRSRETLAARADSGFWVEQTLFQTLHVWRTLGEGHRKLHFWRDRAGREVDFVLEQDGVLVAIEVKQAHHVRMEDAAGIQAFRQALGRRGGAMRGVVLYDGEARRLDENLFALPFGWMVPA